MIYSREHLKEKYPDYVNLNAKLALEISKGHLFRLKQDLYTDDRDELKELVANALYRPSYVSFDWALSVYGMIPERVYAITSACTRKHKSKTYFTPLGRFTYNDVPVDTFAYGVRTINNTYLIASPEKALADKLYSLPPEQSVKGIKELLFDNLRIDEEEFSKLNKADLLELLPKYHCRNCNLLMKYIGGLNNE